MAIDYEKEYDNRGRVPEHPEIFARWQRETDAYRSEARGAELGLAYGPSPRQTLDLFPAKDGDESAPLALFIHGGWWRSLSPTMFSQTAKGPNARGVTVAVAGYDLCPQVSDRRHHRSDARRLPVAVAQIPQAHSRLRPFGRRTSRRLHGGAGLEGLCRRRAQRSGAGGLCDLRRVRPVAAAQRVAEPGLAPRPGRGAARVAALLAGAGRTLTRRGGGRARIERIPAPEQDHRRRLAAGHGDDALRGHRRRRPFHRARPARRSGKAR